MFVYIQTVIGPGLVFFFMFNIDNSIFEFLLPCYCLCNVFMASIFFSHLDDRQSRFLYLFCMLSQPGGPLCPL